MDSEPTRTHSRITLKTWNLQNKEIGKTTINLAFLYISNINNAFCNFFTNVGPNYVTAIPQSKKQSWEKLYIKGLFISFKLITFNNKCYNRTY